MKNIIVLITMLLLMLSLYNSELIRTEAPSTAINWFGIIEPGSQPEPVLDTDCISEPVDTPAVSAVPLSPLTAHQRSAIAERTRDYMSRRYPPIIILQLTLPDDAEDADKVILEADLSFADGVKPTYCIQLMPIITDAPIITIGSTVYDLQKLLDKEHAISATPDRDGKFRFNISELIPLIASGEVSNRFIIKPFMPVDKFEIPEYTDNPFTMVLFEDR